jgi:hypothetical protein
MSDDTTTDLLQPDVSALLQAFPQEELDPELEAYLENVNRLGTCIRHPLVYSMMHSPVLNGMVNQQLRYKQDALAAAEKAEEWHSYIWLHERPYRVNAFVNIAPRMSDVQYWQTLADLWIDSENIRQSPRVWEGLMRSKRPNREAIMDEGELAELAAMPGLIVVYQGHTTRKHDGWSWTINRSKAEWFAHRFSSFESSPPVLTEGVVYKRNVIAYFTSRGESEIVADRRNVKERKSTDLEPKP